VLFYRQPETAAPINRFVRIMVPEFHQIGRIMIYAGIFILVLGVLFFFGDKIPFLGKLPGDIYIKRKDFTFYFPIVTSILLSLLISLIIYLLKK
jgi:hypothetical protein